MFKLGDTVKLVIAMNGTKQTITRDCTGTDGKMQVEVCNRWYFADGDRQGSAVNGSTAYITEPKA